MKQLHIIYILIGCAFGASAQTNFHKYSTGFSIGSTANVGDSRVSKTGISYSAAFDYYLTPYTNLGFELQVGQLKGGHLAYGAFVNKYGLISFNGKIQLGQFLNDTQLNNFILWHLRGLYAGSGLAAVRSSSSFPNVKGKFIAYEIVLPLTLGININLQNKWQEYSKFTLNVNYQTMVSFEDGLDGYIDVNSNTKDVYSYFSVGIRFNFGTIGLDQSKRRM